MARSFAWTALYVYHQNRPLPSLDVRASFVRFNDRSASGGGIGNAGDGIICSLVIAPGDVIYVVLEGGYGAGGLIERTIRRNMTVRETVSGVCPPNRVEHRIAVGDTGAHMSLCIEALAHTTKYVCGGTWP